MTIKRNPPPRQIRVEKSAADAPSFWKKFENQFSTWAQEVVNLFTGNIMFGTHCFSEIRVIELRAPGSGNTFSFPIQTRFTEPVAGVVLLKASLKDNPIAAISPPVAIDWKPSEDSLVTLTAVEGVAAGTDIVLSLLIVGG